MNHATALMLDDHKRGQRWSQVVTVVEGYAKCMTDTRSALVPDPGKIRSLLEPLDFDHGFDVLDAVDFVFQGLWEHQVHTPHPRNQKTFSRGTRPG